jgi:hypothetical protein
MTAYRAMGGLTVPPFYGEHVLPTYASMIPIDLIPGQNRTAPIVSWAGWHQYLLQKIMAEPEATFRHLLRVCPALGVQITFNRSDFPLASFPGAEVKEAMFKTQIYGMAQRAMSGGYGSRSVFGRGSFAGFGGLGGGVGAGAVGAPAHHSSGTGKLAAKVGLNILNTTITGGVVPGGGAFFPPS